MLPTIEIMTDPINRSGVSKASGSEYNIWIQDAYLHSTSSPYPSKFEFLVRGGVVMPKGRFLLTDRSFYVDQKGRLQVRCEDRLADAAAVLNWLQDHVKTTQKAAA